MSTGRRRAVVALIVAFWVLITIAGARADGYRQYADFMSSLAARGAPDPWLGRAALLCTASAHLLVAAALIRRDRIIGGAVGLAGGFLIGVAAFPVTCPSGAPYCVGAPATPDVVDSLHVVAVLGYAIAMLLAMVRAGVVLLHTPRGRTLGIWSLVAAALFVIALALTQGPQPGTAQRWWALAGQVWLIVAAAGIGPGDRSVRVVESSTTRPGAGSP